MVKHFFRGFFWAVLVATIAAWLFFGYVIASTREAILVEDRHYGLDDRVIGPGEARFLASRIYPGRVVLHRVDIGPRVLRISHKKGLAESEMLGLDDSFYVQTELRLEYQLDPASLPGLFQRLEEPDWNRLDDYLADRLKFFLNRKLGEVYEDNQDLTRLETTLYEYIQGPVLAELNSEFAKEGVRFRNVLPSRLYVPDPALYRAILADEELILSQKRERLRIVDDAQARQQAEKIQDEAYFARLERIGQLIRRYPQLKDYLAVDRLSENVEVMVVPSDRWFPTESAARRLSSNRTAGSGAAAKRAEPLPIAPAPRPERGTNSGGNRFRDLTPP
ncbi:MAG: hypothetical protein RIF32_03260 [Leptospirales bacterium]|jgi:hypothetical protein